MSKPKKRVLSSTFTLFSASALVLALVGCGGGSDGTQIETGQTLQESSAIGNPQPSEDPTTTEPVEQITAATGVQVVYADASQQAGADANYIDAQWVKMQTCLQITAQTPTVKVVSGRITPLSDDDDVMRFIDGSVLATATVTSSEATIQIAESDFDGSSGDKGSYLRSIFGRYLWFSASLPERDYPYECANQ